MRNHARGNFQTADCTIFLMECTTVLSLRYPYRGRQKTDDSQLQRIHNFRLLDSGPKHWQGYRLRRAAEAEIAPSRASKAHLMTNRMGRREVVGALLPLAAGLSGRISAMKPYDEMWVFDQFGHVGQQPVRLVGAPGLTGSPWGAAIQFDGVHDALLIDCHPLAGARTFTFEALFRPDGGAFQQRWFHLESCADPSTAPGTSSTRMLFEIRVVSERWYLDAFMAGPGYKQPLVTPSETWPIGRWHHVAQSYDGQTYRSFVNGQMQAAIAMPFVPQGPGRCSIGARLNAVDYFHGAVRAASFSRVALAPAQFRLFDRPAGASGRKGSRPISVHRSRSDA